MTRRSWVGVLLVAGLFSVGAIGCQALTRAEASAALEEAGLAAEAEALTSGSVEIGTRFTIGMAAEDAAMELSSFIESQLPCAAITVEGATLSIEYGANPGSCTYRGQTYGGVHAITVMRNEMDDVVVSHRWEDLNDDRVTVTGTAMVTWSFADETRHVVHELTWTRLSDGRSATGSGDRLQRSLEGGIFEGFGVDGTRAWEGESGTWTLGIDGVEMRWVDPVPQAGTYTLSTPESKTLSLGFSRVDGDTITVTISSGARSYDFDVTTLPAEE
ncbi:MAG: hypothetical protein SangKO_008310 [Sandaracinaceae bacterium]